MWQRATSGINQWQFRTVDLYSSSLDRARDWRLIDGLLGAIEEIKTLPIHGALSTQIAVQETKNYDQQPLICQIPRPLSLYIPPPATPSSSSTLSCPNLSAEN